MKLIVLLTALLAAPEATVPRSMLMEVEGRMNDTFRTASTEPYDLLGTARGTYMEGYGALFTVELNLVYVSAMSPFRPAMTKEEIAQLHDRKVRKLSVLKDQLREQMLAASGTLTKVPPRERIAMEAFLWSYNWETTTGIPRRIILSAERQKLLDAKAAKADRSTLSFIQEQEL